MAKLPLDKMAAQLEDIAKDITGEYERKKVYPWDRIADATATIAEAVGAKYPTRKYSTKKAQVADTINAIADADVSGKNDYYKLLARTIEDVVIPDGIVSIPELMFYRCMHIKSITIPDSTILIGAGAFIGAGRENGGKKFPLVANSVEEISGVLSVGNTECEAFNGAESINKLVLPAIKKIQGRAFVGCFGLEYIYLGPNCATIDSGAFGGVPITCKVECGFVEGAVSGFPDNAGFAGNPADLDITYNVPAPTIEY